MQCHNFNEDWTFEKADQADRLKAFYGNSNAVAVTLPHDAMIREKEIRTVLQEHRVDFIQEVCIHIEKNLWLKMSGKSRMYFWNLKEFMELQESGLMER